MRPDDDRFMDEDMRSFWRSLFGPLAGDLRLYGGTALALYLNHRRSTDFDFVTPEPVVDLRFVGGLRWLKDGRMNGGPGMVDVRLEGRRRQLLVTIMEAGPMVPLPRHSPLSAVNGVAVAHPADLVAAKALACMSRAMTRDFFDLTEAISAWPRLAREAVIGVEGLPAARLAARLADPVPEVVAALGHDRLKALRDFADDIFRPVSSGDTRMDGERP